MTSCVYMKIRWSFAVGVSVPQTAENFQRISVIFTKKEGRRARKEAKTVFPKREERAILLFTQKRKWYPVEQTRHSDEILATAPIGKLILKLAVPSVAAQIINMLYNIVDRIYIGHIPEIGDVALTGVGVTFPIITLISAFAAFAGQGGAPLAAIQLGAKRRVEAQRILGNSLTMLLCAAVVLTVGFSIFQEPILYAFGASDATIGYAKEYIGIYLLGTVFVQLALGLNPFISAQGRATTAMLSVLIGAILNIVLDPIFIFVLGMGVRGAALATILSQAVSAAWVVVFLCSRRSSLRLHRVFSDPQQAHHRPHRRSGRGPLHHAVHREPGNRGAQHGDADLRRGPVCGLHHHHAVHHADDRHARPGHHPGHPAHYELQLRGPELPAGAPDVQAAAHHHLVRDLRRLSGHCPVPRPAGPDLSLPSPS